MPNSSMVERRAVNSLVVGSSPTLAVFKKTFDISIKVV